MGKPLPGAWGLPLLVGLLVVGTWVYVAGLFLPGYNQSRLDVGYTFGPHNSDLYAYWVPAREWLLHGRDPYSPEVTAAIQQGFYGRLLAPDDPVRATLAFVPPLYLIFLVLPAALIPFEVLEPAVYCVIPLVVALTVVWWQRAFRWPLARGRLVLLMLLATCSIPAIYSFYLQQLSLLVVVFMAGAAACLARQRYGWAGVLLALATVKPQLCAVVILWLLAWAACDWPRRKGLIVGFGGTLALLIGGAFVLVPQWPLEWRAALSDYTGYATGPALLGVWLSPALATAGQVGIGVALAGWLWQTRRAGPGSPAFSLGLALTCFYGLLLIPSWVFYNQLLLYPAILLILQQRAILGGAGALGRVAYGATLVCLLWFWVTATGLALVWAAATVVGASAVVATVTGIWQLPWISGLVLPTLLLLPLAILAWRTLARPGLPARETI